MLSTRATMARTAFSSTRLARTHTSPRFSLSTGKALFSTSTAKTLNQARFERYKEYALNVGIAAGLVGALYIGFIEDCPCPKEEYPIIWPLR
ncbi:unnamed protein product [Zymoseptoria tritici ST99CH_3D7]|uniref:Uncharacterized protein n=2 Tax=Zymoseptoria tritici TaxID=1047171 RepID=A0A1X7RK43_ZYMT9|nr:unnamed protein product [Zymoseptoria tritici ST99CH_3D7]SMR46309.1 unnamed protein product [Zymoseptoria tritici ST99CH_1E4]